LVRDGDVGLGLVQALATAEPLAGMVGEIVAVRGKEVAMGTEGSAVVIKTALEAGEGEFVIVSVADADGAQGMQDGVDIGEDVIVAFGGIAEVLADLEGGEAGAQVSQAGDGEGVVIVVGRGEGAGDGPEDEQAIVDDVEGLGFVAEVMLAVGSGTLLGILVRIGAGAGLV
jgi:hypothetical protein